MTAILSGVSMKASRHAAEPYTHNIIIHAALYIYYTAGIFRRVKFSWMHAATVVLEIIRRWNFHRTRPVPTREVMWSRTITFIRGLIFRGRKSTAKTANNNSPRKVPAIRYIHYYLDNYTR